MYSHERKTKIIDLIDVQSSVSVNTLAELLHTSKETIRRDLNDLETAGALTRTHGGAISNTNKSHTDKQVKYGDPTLRSEYPFALRHIQNISEKKMIAQKAAALIENHDTIFIDNSSTTLFLLDYIPRDYQLTIITNSIKVLLEASKYEHSDYTLIALAGFYNRNNYSVYGTQTIQSAGDFFPNKTFISCTGITLHNRLTDINLHEVDTKKALIEKSEITYLLADHTKFETNGPFFLSDFNVIDYIITDDYTHSPQVIECLRIIADNSNVRIITN